MSDAMKVAMKKGAKPNWSTAMRASAPPVPPAGGMSVKLSGALGHSATCYCHAVRRTADRLLVNVIKRPAGVKLKVGV